MLAEAFARFLDGVQAVAGARAAASTALSQGREVIAAEARREARHGLRMIIDAGILKPGKGPPDTGAVLTSIVDGAAAHQLGSLQAVADASALIFTHSLLDAGVVDLCRITMTLRPAAWATKLDSKKVQLAELKGRSYEELFADMLATYAGTLGHDSLPKNVERLVSVLRPDADELSGANFEFSVDRLRDLDALRHEIVHKTGPRVLDDVGDAIDYLQAVFFRLWALVMRKHGVFLDEEALRGAVSRQPVTAE